MRRSARGAVAPLGVALALATTAGACQDRPAAAPPEKLVFAMSRTPGTGLAHLALTKGYFAAEGLEVTAQHHDFGRLSLAAVLDGNADLATVADTPVVLATLRGHRVAIMATVWSTARNNGLLVRRAAGIPDVRGLVGKRIGVPRGTTAEFFLDTILLRSGILSSQVILRDLKPDAMEAALRAGEVDAVAVFLPYSGRLVRALSGQVTRLETTGFFETYGVAALADFPQRRPGTAEKVVRALLRAEAFAREQPAEARRVAAEAARQPAADFADLWDQFEYRVRLDQGLLVLLEAQARWAIRSGLVPAQPTPDFRQVLVPGPLRAASPDAVELGH